jgi:hypothetical protein
MNLEAYLKGCKRGEFEWYCVESGTYGDGNSVDTEEVNLKGRGASIYRHACDLFQAEVDDLNAEPFYAEKEFTTRRSARKWCEKIIQKDIKDNKS